MRNPLRDYLASRALLTAVVYTGVVTLPLFLVSAQILQLGRELDFGVARIGLATASFFGMAALTANPAGRVISRIGPGRGLRIGGFLGVASCVIVALASEWWIIPIAMAVSGTGNGLIQVSANVAIFDGVAKGRQGLAFGAKQASVPFASLVAGINDYAHDYSAHLYHCETRQNSSYETGLKVPFSTLVSVSPFRAATTS